MTPKEFLEKFPIGTTIQSIDSKEIFQVVDFLSYNVFVQVIKTRSIHYIPGQLMLLPPTLFNSFKKINKA